MCGHPCLPRVTHTQAMGREAGIEFNHKADDRGGRLVVNTIDALRLIDYAQATLPASRVNALAEEVIWAHHVDGRDVSDADVLASIGSSYGIGYDTVHAFISDSSAMAPVPGSPEALAAIGQGPELAALECGSNGDGSGGGGGGDSELETCGTDGDGDSGHGARAEATVPADGGVATLASAVGAAKARSARGDDKDAFALATEETFSQVGDAHSVRLRDMAAKRAGIHAVPHIEIWRDFHNGDVGVDCTLPAVQHPFWIRGRGSAKGTAQQPIVIEGANPVESFLSAFQELAAMKPAGYARDA